MTIRTVIERGAKVYIQQVKDAGSLLIGKGEGLEGVLERFQSDYNAHAMRRTRARGNAKRKPK
jgi:hypothetical protein